MTRSPFDVSGFHRCDEPIASRCLVRAVAGSLLLAALSLCISVAVTALSIKVSMAMPVIG